MRHKPAYFFGVGVLALAVLALPHFATGSAGAADGLEPAERLEIPMSIQLEHEAIHSVLEVATKAPGRVGLAARDLVEVLHPHFLREEQIALPPLGLLKPLADGVYVPEAVLSEALAMSDSLRAELPQMREEHVDIRAAVERLRLAAREEQALEYERFAEQLALHARTEEEVLYPAAILVGDVIRARQRAE